MILVERCSPNSLEAVTMIGIFLPGMTIILPWSAPSTPSFAACTAEICFPETATPELRLKAVSVGPGQRQETFTGDPALRSSSWIASVSLTT